MATLTWQRYAIVLVIGFPVFVAVTILRFFAATWVVILNIHLLAYLLPGLVVGFVWPKESWRLGLGLVASLWGMWMVALLFSDFHGLDAMNTIVPLSVATLAACFGSYLGAKVSPRK